MAICGELVVEDLKGGAAEAGRVGDEGALGGGMGLAELADGLVDLAGDIHIGGAKGEEMGGGEAPGFDVRMGGIEPGERRGDRVDGEDGGECGWVAGLAEVEAEDGVGDGDAGGWHG